MTRKIIHTLLCAGALFAAAPAFADEPKVPMTAEEHFTLAKQYKEDAAKYKKIADDHRTMADAYRKANPQSRKGWEGQKSAKVEAMDKHCATLAKDADKLAADAEKAADFHTLRGKELQGK